MFRLNGKREFVFTRTDGGYGRGFFAYVVGAAGVLHVQHSFGSERDNRVNETTARIHNRYGATCAVRSYCLVIGSGRGAHHNTRNLRFRQT